MSSRHLCRTIALQTLYELDFLKSEEKPALDWSKILERNLKESNKNFSDKQEFAKILVEGVIKNLSKIDNYLQKYASEWPIEQITLIDRNILRIGIFEMIFSEETAPKIAIDEAIEVAKSFGGDASGKFINGVLGAIYEDLKKNKKIKE